MSSSTKQEFFAVGVMFVISTLLFFGMRFTRASSPTIPQVAEK
jgi:hypothetical protein